MLLNESQKHYANLITEELHVTDKAKLNWMAQYAQIHAIHEGVETPGAGHGPIYATPFNTIGAANPSFPLGDPNAPFDPTNGAPFHSNEYLKGSGDVPMSTLSTALEIAAVTIGFDLVPVVPSAGPMAILTFNDYPYAGGKLGLFNETALDGKGEGADNKPIYIAFTSQNLEALTKAAKGDKEAEPAVEPMEEFQPYEITNGRKTFKGLYMGTSRINGAIILQVKSVKEGDKDISVSEWALGSKENAVEINGVTINEMGTQTTTTGEGDDATTTETPIYCAVVPELVKGITDHVQSFSNFFGTNSVDETTGELVNTPSNDPMSRAENETGTGNIIGARMFSKVIRMGAYEAVGQVTRQQLQDMPLYGIDVLGGVIEACQNEISQAINNRILDRLFKLGVENYKVQRAVQGVDLNLYMGLKDNYKLSDFSGGVPYSKFVGIDGKQAADVFVKPAIVNTNAENVITHQRRIMSRILAASNLIASVTRRGRASWAVTNAQILTALQDCAGFVVAPMVNDLVQGGEESLYWAGSLAGLKIYVDPYMRWDDTRICCGRKANVTNNRVQGSGVVFMPYILADTVQIIAEGTMAPKVLINSRFAIADCGWYPEQNYYTFMVDFDESTLI